MHDVFISYSTRNQSEADMVRLVLEKNGISCWMAPDDIPGGSNYAKEIPDAIRSARIFLLLLSFESQRSQWVSRELDLAVNETKVIIPFVLEECELLEEFNFYLVGAQRIEAYQKKAEAFQILVHRIRALLSVGSDSVPESGEIVSSGIVRYASNEYTKEKAEAFVKTFIADDIIFGYGRFRDKKAEKLRRHLKIPGEDEIFLAYDDTLFRSGKNGFALSTSGIYCRPWGEAFSIYMSWKSLMSADRFEYRNFLLTDLFACTPEGEVQIAYINLLKKEDKQFLLRFFQRLRDAMRREFG